MRQRYNSWVKGTLLISILGVRGNYHEGLYLDARGKRETDTNQWWITPDEAYTTMTFALSRTIRTYRLEKPADAMFRLAEENQVKLEASTIKKVRIDFDNVYDEEEAATKFSEQELESSLTMIDGKFPVWTYECIQYTIDDKAQGTAVQRLKQTLITPMRHWFNNIG